MHSLKVIKITCAEAMDDDDPAAKGAFRAIVDPGSVLEMAQIIEMLHARLAQTGADPEMVERVRVQLRGGWAGPLPGEAGWPGY
jgi:hypothetical protein